jgi:spore germination protein KC
MSLKEIQGLKWLNQVNYTIPVNLIKKNVGLQIKNSTAKIDLIKGKKPEYKIKIKANAILTENERGLSKKTIIKSLKKRIQKELMSTIKKGDELKVDLLNISEKPYRYSFKRDIKTINEINSLSIKEIDVNVHIIQSQT